MERYTTVPAYLDGHEDWREVLEYLRDILRETDLWETVKWGGPCYTINNKNVIGLGAFKEFVSVWFFQGVLLKDTHHVLVNAKEGKAKALRQWRFQNVREINDSLLRAYFDEAIENQKEGREIRANRSKPL